MKKLVYKAQTTSLENLESQISQINDLIKTYRKMNFDLKQLTRQKPSKNMEQSFMSLVSRHNGSPESQGQKELKMVNERIQKYERMGEMNRSKKEQVEGRI